MINKRLQWFIERIGKRVYRGAVSCACSVCVGVTNNGLVIQDELHANYLWEMEGISHLESEHPVTYSDAITK